MAEPIEWLPDGTPFSPRFSDAYQPEGGGLAQARQVFLAGCGLPLAWAGQSQWRVLQTGFGLGLNFLATWQAWRDDPARPRLLHFVATEAHVVPAADLLRATLRAASAHPKLRPLADQLAAQWQGLLPGTHRLVFEGGQVLLTLGVGESTRWLRGQRLCVDSVYLDGFGPDRNPGLWDSYALKAVARACRRGTQLASWTTDPDVIDGLRQAGFEVQGALGTQPERDHLHRDCLQAVYAPAWEPKKAHDARWPQQAPSQHEGHRPTRKADEANQAAEAQAPEAKPTAPRCVVIGAGLAGAAVAASLARRGWAVTVLDAKPSPAQGASGLPAGLLAPHVSPDDGVLSQLSRSGLRATRQAAAALLAPSDWQASGLLQRRLDTSARLPSNWPAAGAFWSRPAAPHELAQGTDAQAPLWHAAGAWIKPARLVQALLQGPGISLRCGQAVAELRQVSTAADSPLWHALDASGQCLAEAELVVVASGPDSVALLASAQRPLQSCFKLPLQPVRGQVLWGRWPDEPAQQQALATALPPTPVNGLGGLIPAFAGDDGRRHWLLGATYERDQAQNLVRDEDQQLLLERLDVLWPSAAKALKRDTSTSGLAHAGQPSQLPAIESWAGVRCVSPDRLPMVGPLDPALPGLWLCTAMGSRGLTFALLCGEVLAAWMHDEPLPIEKRLAQHLLASRFKRA